MEPCPRCGSESTPDPENGLLWCFRCLWFFRTDPDQCRGGSRLERFTNTRAPYPVRKH
ncbi:hypothetical protein ACFH04_25905 [Streptomyces noboritoensis]|uniref:Insertion element protein n=1 Tax=Streptomyces noboritoensis TaxID=67337 RepID=A0ABV6TMV0_9ACTN|nr:hypothetical protein GCM10010278_52830 [Streptomyces melanogenes]